jgi:plastocyanin
MDYFKCVVAVLVCLLLFQSGVHAADQTFEATVGQDGIQRVEMVGGEYFFNPKHVIVKVNIPVELKMSKDPGMTPHNIVMMAPEAGIEFVEELTTTPKTIKFVPTKTGTYPLYCSKKLPFVKSHRDRGMEGVLEVVPQQRRE